MNYLDKKARVPGWEITFLYQGAVVALFWPAKSKWEAWQSFLAAYPGMRILSVRPYRLARDILSEHLAVTRAGLDHVLPHSQCGTSPEHAGRGQAPPRRARRKEAA